MTKPVSEKKELDPAVRKFFEDIGRKNGNALKARHGSEYFRRISAMRRTHGRQRIEPVEVKKEEGKKENA
jgi:hypothetical protein